MLAGWTQGPNTNVHYAHDVLARDRIIRKGHDPFAHQCLPTPVGVGGGGVGARPPQSED